MLLTNQAVQLRSGNLSLIDTPVPARPPGFALLRMRLAGICNTDLELQRGYYNFSGVPGHEFVADVVEADSPDLQGKRVVGEINLVCHSCPNCLSGKATHCSNRSVLGIKDHPGAFQSFFTLPESNLFILPDNIADEDAVFVEPLAAAWQVIAQVDPNSGTRALVVGDGKLGLLVSHVLGECGAHVSVLGRHPDRGHLLPGCRWISSEDSERFPLVVECSGSGTGLQSALNRVLPRGTLVMKSTVADRQSLNLSQAVVDEITLVGSRCGPFDRAIKALSRSAFRPRTLIEAEYPLEEAELAFRHAASPGTLKVVLRAGQGT